MPSLSLPTLGTILGTSAAATGVGAGTAGAAAGLGTAAAAAGGVAAGTAAAGGLTASTIIPAALAGVGAATSIAKASGILDPKAKPPPLMPDPAARDAALRKRLAGAQGSSGRDSTILTDRLGG